MLSVLVFLIVTFLAITQIPNDFFEDDVPICEFEDDASPQVGRKEKAKVQRSAAPGAKKEEAAPEPKKEADAPFTLALDMDFAAEEAEYEGGGDIAYEGGGDIEEYKGDDHTGDQDHHPEVKDTKNIYENDR